MIMVEISVINNNNDNWSDISILSDFMSYKSHI